ncbi:hypothetical protein VB740_27250 [Nostoc sp. UHCC 0251]|nr:hypothetical protein [Nostoc sp. UHCC 0251]
MYDKTLQHNIAPQRLTLCVATGASTRALTLRGNTLYLMPND